MINSLTNKFLQAASQAPNGRRGKKPLIRKLTPNESSAFAHSYNGTASPITASVIASASGSAILDAARNVVEPIKTQVNGYRNGNDGHQNGNGIHNGTSVTSTSATPTAVETAETQLGKGKAGETQPAKQSNATNLLSKQSFNLSLISLGLSVAGFVVKPLAIVALGFVILGSPELIRRTYVEFVKERKTTVDMLIVATFVVGLGLGIGAILTGHAIFTFMLSLNIFLANYAQRLMRKVREDAKGSLVDIFKQQPTSVWSLVDGLEVEVSVDSLHEGDIVVVNAGETIAIDGKVTDGFASVDQHILTGESQPAEKGPGDQVFALTMVASGRIQILVEKTGEQTTAAQIGQVLNQTMNFKTNMQIWAEDMANKSVVPTLVTSAAILPFMPGVSWGMLVAHPKYRGIVATYINILSYLEVTSKEGILLKDGRVLEILNQVDTVVFDKTGTLTETQPHVGQVHTWNQAFTADQVLTYAAAAEYRQTHPVALAILEEADARVLPIPTIEEAAYKVGYGLTVTLDSKTVRVGSLRFMMDEALTLPPNAEATKDLAHQYGHSLIFVAVDTAVVGAIELEPTVRPEAQAIVEGLRERGIESTYIISGDHEAPTRKLAGDLGIDHYFAETLPEDKANLIDQLQKEGKTVCYVGDGINDAIALKTAAVSISLQGASSVAVDTAQVVLMDESLNKLCELFDIAADFERNMKKTMGLVIAPHLLSLAGLIFFHFGLLSVIVLCQVGLGIGVGNALLPRLARRQSNHQLEDESLKK